jgi:hypothetical protein
VSVSDTRISMSSVSRVHVSGDLALVYLGYVISGGKLKVDLTKMEAIMKWLVPTTITEVKSFIGATQYLRKFIASFLLVAAPLHAITMSGKSFQWRKNQQKDFNEPKRKINQALILAL